VRFSGTFEYLLPEAKCYEDMGYAYNQAVLSSPGNLGKRLNKVDNKTHFFYVTSAILSAFYFIEAYVNGVAFDFCYRTGDSSKINRRAEGASLRMGFKAGPRKMGEL